MKANKKLIVFAFLGVISTALTSCGFDLSGQEAKAKLESFLTKEDVIKEKLSKKNKFELTYSLTINQYYRFAKNYEIKSTYDKKRGYIYYSYSNSNMKYTLYCYISGDKFYKVENENDYKLVAVISKINEHSKEIIEQTANEIKEDVFLIAMDFTNTLLEAIDFSDKSIIGLSNQNVKFSSFSEDSLSVDTLLAHGNDAYDLYNEFIITAKYEEYFPKYIKENIAERLEPGNNQNIIYRNESLFINDKVSPKLVYPDLSNYEVKIINK